MYKRSVEDPEGFWAEYAEELHWFKKWDRVFEGDFGKARVKWFVGESSMLPITALTAIFNRDRGQGCHPLDRGIRGEQDLYL